MSSPIRNSHKVQIANFLSTSMLRPRPIPRTHFCTFIAAALARNQVQWMTEKFLNLNKSKWQRRPDRTQQCLRPHLLWLHDSMEKSIYLYSVLFLYRGRGRNYNRFIFSPTIFFGQVEKKTVATTPRTPSTKRTLKDQALDSSSSQKRPRMSSSSETPKNHKNQKSLHCAVCGHPRTALQRGAGCELCMKVLRKEVGHQKLSLCISNEALMQQIAAKSKALREETPDNIKPKHGNSVRMRLNRLEKLLLTLVDHFGLEHWKHILRCSVFRGDCVNTVTGKGIDEQNALAEKWIIQWWLHGFAYCAPLLSKGFRGKPPQNINGRWTNKQNHAEFHGVGMDNACPHVWCFCFLYRFTVDDPSFFGKTISDNICHLLVKWSNKQRHTCSFRWNGDPLHLRGPTQHGVLETICCSYVSCLCLRPRSF